MSRSQSSKLFSSKSARGSRNNQAQLELVDNTRPIKAFRSVGKIEAKNEAQGQYISAIMSSTLTFGVGPAGVGKTWIVGAMAADALQQGLTERIIITRPAVESCEELGFLPGELADKFMPFLEPFLDVLNERLGAANVQCMIKNGKIVASPIAYMRGKTFKNAWVVLDEAQNITPVGMKMLLTRIGHDTKVIVNGDISQKDIPGMSGLEDAIRRFKNTNQIRIVEFTEEDCVRSGLARAVLEAYRN